MWRSAVVVVALLAPACGSKSSTQFEPKVSSVVVSEEQQLMDVTIVGAPRKGYVEAPKEILLPDSLGDVDDTGTFKARYDLSKQPYGKPLVFDFAVYPTSKKDPATKKIVKIEVTKKPSMTITNGTVTCRGFTCGEASAYFDGAYMLTLETERGTKVDFCGATATVEDRPLQITPNLLGMLATTPIKDLGAHRKECKISITTPGGVTFETSVLIGSLVSVMSAAFTTVPMTFPNEQPVEKRRSLYASGKVYGSATLPPDIDLIVTTEPTFERRSCGYFENNKTNEAAGMFHERLDTTLTIVHRRTGKKLATKQFKGAWPTEKCPGSITRDQMGKVERGALPEADIVKWYESQLEKGS